MEKVYIRPGETRWISVEHSEVAIHMKVAGRTMLVELIKRGDGELPVAQLHNDDGTCFSAPIGYGEAGLYRDQDGHFYGYLHFQPCNATGCEKPEKYFHNIMRNMKIQKSKRIYGSTNE